MKSVCHVILRVSFALGLLLFSPVAKADPDAVTSVGQPAGNGFLSGAGFLFTPTTNLTVTRIGYQDNSQVQPIIRFWSNTNSIIASFAFPAGSGSGLMVYSNINLTLLAGNRYSITLQDPSLNAVTVSAFANYQVAAQLTGFTSAMVQSDGAFTSFTTGVLYLGPNFSFQTAIALPTPPLLKLSLSNATTAIISWPAPSIGFVLQKNSSLSLSNWVPVTNGVTVVNSTNRVMVSPLTNNAFYRLFHP
jgi:hypothetical protein